MSLIMSCSLFNGTNSYPTIPLPPQKTNASDAVMPMNTPTKNKTSASQGSSNASAPTSIKTNNNRQTIYEDRSNGQVTQIKVDNGDNYLPDYYMYPSQQQDLNTNSAPGKDLSTPSWQISW